MKFSCTLDSAESLSVDTLIVLTPSYTGIRDSFLKQIDTAVSGALSDLCEREEFPGKEGTSVSFYKPQGFACARIVMVGLGERRNINPDTYRKALGSVSRLGVVAKASKLGVRLGAKVEASAYQAAVEGFLLGGYKLVEYKSDDSEKNSGPKSLTFVADSAAAARKGEKAAIRGEIIAEGQIEARNLAATPANDLTPKKYAALAQKLARKHGFSCKVLDETEIAREKMGGLLGVAKGSDEPPRFLILKWKGRSDNQKPIVLVGKGVTFDSGGISLKPGLNMHEMKQDMTGSAVVLATVMTAARLKIKRNIMGLIPATENMPSGKATRPGDILKMRNGKTVEIINTDAEGRLILADALDYASEFKPQAVIDIATLTGASLFILGYAGAPITGNSDKLLDIIKQASGNTGERVWGLPIWDDFREQMKSSIADLVNSGGRPAGTLAAAAFLENFIGEWPWAHIDIAYVDSEPKGRPYVPKGATGFGVRLLTDTLENFKKV
jgi:leucyl aminopeptidase